MYLYISQFVKGEMLMHKLLCGAAFKTIL